MLGASQFIMHMNILKALKNQMGCNVELQYFHPVPTAAITNCSHQNVGSLKKYKYWTHMWGITIETFVHIPLHCPKREPVWSEAPAGRPLPAPYNKSAGNPAAGYKESMASLASSVVSFTLFLSPLSGQAMYTLTLLSIPSPFYCPELSSLSHNSNHFFYAPIQ